MLLTGLLLGLLGLLWSLEMLGILGLLGPHRHDAGRWTGWTRSAPV